MDKWKSNLNIFQLYITKDIQLFTLDKKQFVTLIAPSIKELTKNIDLNTCVNFLRSSFSELKAAFKLWKPKTLYDIFTILLTDAGQYRELVAYKSQVLQGFKQLFKEEVTISNKLITIGNIILTEQLFNYIVYIVRRLNGEEVDEPIVAENPEDQAFLNQMAIMNEKVRQIKTSNGVKEDALLKVFVTIGYSFPQFNFDYLLNQTMYQILWLHKYAAKQINYSVEEKAYATGNMKKKLKFFLENK